VTLTAETPRIDLGAWFRSRLAAGYDPVRGSRILAIRIASAQGQAYESAPMLVAPLATSGGLVQADASKDAVGGGRRNNVILSAPGAEHVTSGGVSMLKPSCTSPPADSISVFQ